MKAIQVKLTTGAQFTDVSVEDGPMEGFVQIEVPTTTLDADAQDVDGMLDFFHELISGSVVMDVTLLEKADEMARSWYEGHLHEANTEQLEDRIYTFQTKLRNNGFEDEEQIEKVSDLLLKALDRHTTTLVVPSAKVQSITTAE